MRIVIADDNPDDRALARRALESVFAEAQIVEVRDLAGLERALAGAYDVLVTDYQLHWTTGLKILRASKARHPDVPVIMFTATGTQETAVEAMKSGLDDYVVKSPRHFVRLPAAVAAALERAEVRRRAAGLEQRLQTLLNILEVGVFRTSIYGELLECNPAFLRVLGVKTIEEARASELWGRIRWRQGHPTALDLIPDVGAQTTYDVRLTRSDGTQTWVRVSQVLASPEGEPVIDGLAEDITAERRSAEHSRRLTDSLELEVRRRTEELQRANVDLEGFVTRVSGELQGLVQTVRGLVRELSALPEVLSPETRTLLDRLAAGADSLERTLQSHVQR